MPAWRQWHRRCFPRETDSAPRVQLSYCRLISPATVVTLWAGTVTEKDAGEIGAMGGSGVQ